MNIGELALKVRNKTGFPIFEEDIPKFAHALIAEYEAAGSEPVAYRTWRETKMYGMWEYRTDELELNDDDWEPLYARPDQKVAELEARLVSLKLEQTMRKHAEASNARLLIELSQIEAQNAALLVAIEAKQKALKMVEWEEYNDPDWGMQVFCPNCLREKKHGHYECRLAEALTLSPSAELLEARDRKRDAKLLRAVDRYLLDIGDSCSDDPLNELAKARESGEWQPLLDGD